MAAKCPQCQAENPESSKFCTECRSRLSLGGEVQFRLLMEQLRDESDFLDRVFGPAK